MAKKQNVVVFCAHPDDEIIGAGGTIAKYSKEGYNVYAVIFSYGEGSHWWLKKKYTAEMRVKESQEAGKVVGVKDTVFLGLKDLHLTSEIKQPRVKQILKDIMKKYKPVKVFTHSMDDVLYKDHKAVHEIITTFLDEVKYSGELYAFNIWTMNVRKTDSPKLIVDISDTFGDKIKSLKCFSSQWLALAQLTPAVYARAMKNGFKHGYRYAEEFYKLK